MSKEVHATSGDQPLADPALSVSLDITEIPEEEQCADPDGEPIGPSEEAEFKTAAQRIMHITECELKALDIKISDLSQQKDLIEQEIAVVSGEREELLKAIGRPSAKTDHIAHVTRATAEQSRKAREFLFDGLTCGHFGPKHKQSDLVEMIFNHTGVHISPSYVGRVIKAWVAQQQFALGDGSGSHLES